MELKMKTSVWFKLCLIILCITVIASLFSCGTAGEVTTDQKPSESTETTLNTTEKVTEAITEETTEEITDEKTTTEEITTEEITEEITTEEITTEEVTEVVTEDPAVLEIAQRIPEFFGKNDLISAKINSGLTAEATVDGVKFVNPWGDDGNVTLFSGRDGTKVTGQYVFFKYRASENTHFVLYTATDFPTSTGFRSKALDTNNFIVTDEQWHLLIVDVASVISFEANEAGQYCAQHLRLDIEGGKGIWAEIAYVGYTDNLDVIKEYAQATEDEANIQSVCPCFDGHQVYKYADRDTHIAVCTLCDKETPLSHSGATYGTWNDANHCYLSDAACEICGRRYNFGSNIYVESENIKLFESAWGTASFVEQEDGVIYTQFYNNREYNVWSSGYFHINPSLVASGQYLVIRYRVPKTEGELTLTISADTAGGHTNGYNDRHDIPLIVDNEWHTAVIDLSLTPNYIPNGEGIYTLSNVSRILTQYWSADDIVQFDWFKMYDAYDQIPAEYLTETVIVETQTE